MPFLSSHWKGLTYSREITYEKGKIHDDEGKLLLFNLEAILSQIETRFGSFSELAKQTGAKEPSITTPM